MRKTARLHLDLGPKEKCTELWQKFRIAGEQEDPGLRGVVGSSDGDGGRGYPFLSIST